VPKQPWYEGGYRANIVTYAMAKVFHDATSETQALDLDAVWKRQAISDALLRALLLAAAEAHDAITNPPTGVRNMSEWAKKQACWEGLRIRKLEYDEDFETCLLLNESVRIAERDQKKKTRLTEGINFQTEVVNLGAPFWNEVLQWGRSNKKLTGKDLQILQICTSMPRRLPKDYEAQHAMTVLQKLKDAGFLHA